MANITTGLEDELSDREIDWQMAYKELRSMADIVREGRIGDLYPTPTIVVTPADMCKSSLLHDLCSGNAILSQP